MLLTEMKKIPRIKLSENEDYKDFIQNNKVKFWEMVLEAAQQLIDNPSIEKYPAFVLLGGNLQQDEEFVVDRKKIVETLERGRKELEFLEEYELCSDVVKHIESFKKPKKKRGRPPKKK